MSTKTAVEIGAGMLAAAAAAGAGYYFYADKNAKKHRQSASKWAQGMKKEVMKEAKKIKKLDKKAVAAIVDKVSAMYQGVRSVDSKHLRAAAAELKRNWKEVGREIAGAKMTVTRKGTAKKKVRKATETVVTRPKKTAKKKAKRASRK